MILALSNSFSQKPKEKFINSKIEWNKTKISTLPYKFDYTSINTDKFRNTFDIKKNENSEINKLFSDQTKFRVKEKIYPIDYIHKGNAYFFKRLPNIGDIKVIIYIYYSSDADDYYAPFLELQTVSKKNEIIDKIIIGGIREYECGWDRSVIINKNYNIYLKDYQYCYDIEEDKLVEEKEFRNKFRINSKGNIKKIET